MRTTIAWTLTMVVGVVAVAANPASAQVNPPATKKAGSGAPPAARPAQQPAATPDPAATKALQEAYLKAREEMNSLLDEWELQSRKITSIDVAFDRIDKGGLAWGDQYFKGRAMLQSPNLACLEFRKYKVDADGKPVAKVDSKGRRVAQLDADPSERIVCTGTEVLQYTWDDRKMFVFPLDKSVRQKALQQGPLPFLFNMKAAEAKQRYSMTLAKQNADVYLIEIIPNEEIDKQSFTKAFLWLNKQTFLPDQLWLFPVGNKEHQEFKFTGNDNTIKANVPLDQSFFAYTRIPNWTEVVNPGADKPTPLVKPGTNAAAPQPKRQATQPGTRPPGRNP